MAVKIYCSRCTNFVKDVLPGDLSKLTGKEICPDCVVYLTKLNSELENEKLKYLSIIDELTKKASSAISEISKSQKKYAEEAISMYKTTRAEIDNRLKDVLK